MRIKRLMSRSLMVVAIAMMLAVVCGCGKETVEITMPKQVAGAITEESAQTQVDVYWDATYSMQGYATIPNGNFYRTLPDELGDIGSTMGEMKFYRFGQDIKPLEGREYRQFSNPGYYDELVTAFHNVIDTADASHLSIVVTDLFESDSDWSNVTKKLKEKYFSQHLAVGIIGIKNPFNGDIFDVGLNAAKFNYNSGSDPARYRPFYLFIMGPEQKVADFMSRWKDRQPDGVEMQYLLLSENLTEEADFSSLQVQSSENLYEDDKLGIKDKRIREFGVDKFGDETKLMVSFNCKPRFGAFSLDMEKLAIVTDVFALDGDVWKSVDDMDGKVETSLAPNPDQAGNYLINVKFTPELSLKPDAVNFIHVSVIPEEKGFRIPDWVRQWNMSNIDVSTTQFDGSKTINFLHVVESLKASVLAASRPALVNMDMVIDAR